MLDCANLKLKNANMYIRGLKMHNLWSVCAVEASCIGSRVLCDTYISRDCNSSCMPPLVYVTTFAPYTQNCPCQKTWTTLITSSPSGRMNPPSKGGYPHRDSSFHNLNGGYLSSDRVLGSLFTHVGPSMCRMRE